jgi:hypothetical protein
MPGEGEEIEGRERLSRNFWPWPNYVRAHSRGFSER